MEYDLRRALPVQVRPVQALIDEDEVVPAMLDACVDARSKRIVDHKSFCVPRPMWSMGRALPRAIVVSPSEADSQTLSAVVRLSALASVRSLAPR